MSRKLFCPFFYSVKIIKHFLFYKPLERQESESLSNDLKFLQDHYRLKIANNGLDICVTHFDDKPCTICMGVVSGQGLLTNEIYSSVKYARKLKL